MEKRTWVWALYNGARINYDPLAVDCYHCNWFHWEYSYRWKILQYSQRPQSAFAICREKRVEGVEVLNGLASAIELLVAMWMEPVVLRRCMRVEMPLGCGRDENEVGRRIVPLFSAWLFGKKLTDVKCHMSHLTPTGCCFVISRTILFKACYSMGCTGWTKQDKGCVGNK